MLVKYPNVFVDTAFAPVENIIDLAESHFAEKIIFGIYFPVKNYFSENLGGKISLSDQYGHDLKILDIIGANLFNIIQNNTKELWI